MSSTRLQPHHSLPAPVVHATFSAQSKSHVLAGVQDAYWSDDEAEDAECPLCLEEMDISDLNFKPCICGYQASCLICRFCWHHIKENLNKRCPACRRIYTDETVEFKPIATQDHKRLTQQKKQRDREKKELDALGRRPLANVRVVQRNIVYVVGLGPRFAKEELIPTLRSTEYFGQYGKITKILLVKRNSPGGGGPVVGLYITYQRREDAARAITAVDGTHSPGGGRDVMRASYGTTKYCMAFLRGVTCSDHSCMNLHEWGDEKDCFTKEDLTTLKHTMKATESRTRIAPNKRTEEDAPLPRAAAWAQKGLNTPAAAAPNTQANMNSVAVTTPVRQPRRGGAPRQPRNVMNTGSSAVQDSRSSQTKAPPERKPNLISASRPSTPVMEPSTAPHTDSKGLRPKELLVSVQLSTSPAPSATTASDRSGFQERTSSTPIRPDSTDSTSSNSYPTSSMPVSASLMVPPGLSAPPGISSPSRPPRAETASPQTPLLASQSSYQMSTAARALLDDVKARRESSLPASSTFSPFPDFDRTLQTLTDDGGGGFSFNLDPKLADEAEFVEPLPDFDVASSVPFRGSYIEAFPALRSGIGFIQSSTSGYSHNINLPIYDPGTPRTGSEHSFEKPYAKGTGYMGLFNPFSELGVESVSTSSSLSRLPYSPGDEERKVSRFGFAQGRKGSTAASLPLLPSPLSHAREHQSFYNPTEDVHHGAGYQWPTDYHEHHVSNSHVTSAQVQHAQAQTMFTHTQTRLPPGGELSEAQLRSFIQSSQARMNDAKNPTDPNDFNSTLLRSSRPFEDPAIMSASFGGPGPEHIFTSMTYGPPPGLPAPQGILSQQNLNGDEPHEGE
ncbi:hypothetical protein BYT27DRAFT_7124516 [Phlegmacium glaucopus]|nr:hypothetical protein BYT27DRAFT_7124516 [Phlegmacium glaucopus]